MRVDILAIFTGALGLAAVVTSAPPLSSTPDDCGAPSTATVFVTIPASIPEPSTVYVMVSASSVEVNLSEAPTSTLTRFATLYSTTTAETVFEQVSVDPSSTTVEIGNSPSHVTITQTTVVPITDVNLTPVPSGGSLTYSETPAVNGILNYVVENGTTYWLDGQTPAPSEFYVYSTSSVTVIPVDATLSTSEQATSTLTLHSTIYFTQQFAMTETLESAPTSTSIIGAITSTSVGTGLPYPKGSGGWNATKATTRGVNSGATNAVSTAMIGGVLASSSPTLVLYSSFNIYETSHTTISKSSLAAESGFNAFTTPSDPGSSTSSASGELITAVVNNHTVTWGGSTNSATSSDTCIETPYAPTSTPAPYVNSTFATSVRVTSGISSVTVLSSSISSFVYSSSSMTTSATSPPSVLPILGSILGVSYSSTASNPPTTLSSSSSLPVYSSSVITNSTVRSTSSVSNSVSGYSSSLTPSSTSSSKTSTSVSTTASPTPSLCGEHGDFTLNFDDIPPLSIGNQSANDVQPEPVFNPYHQFDFSDGFTVVPPPTDPYLPSSPPLLLEFIPNFNVNGTNTQVGPNTAEEGYSGQISDGDGDETGCFHFNMYGASLGCDSEGPPCDFTFSGWQLDASRNEVQITSQKIAVPACPALANCTLSPVNLDNTFQNLAFVRVNVTVAQQPKIWWMDDLRLGWYNNSCTTGLCRQTTHLP